MKKKGVMAEGEELRLNESLIIQAGLWTIYPRREGI